MNYVEALHYLQSLRMFGFKPGLETTRALAAAAGNPERKLRFIHVAGTNGKGSVCAFLESVYRHSGRRVGLYTSPHLIRFGERLQIQRVPILETDLARHVAELRQRAQQHQLEPTLFEFATVLALQYFAEQKVDLVIWETGLGGRWDATNIVTPLASVITNIGLDHMEVLGPTLLAIAAEKAGIIKPGVPVLTATTDAESEAILRYKARELDSPYLLLEATDVAALRGEVGLLGPHQRTNAALAAATVRLLRALLPVTDSMLAEGLATTSWPGRLQMVHRGIQRFLLDGAHNLPGARALREALPGVVEGHRPVMIVGMLRDKDCRGVLAELIPLVSRVVTAPVGSPRSASPEELRALAVATGLGRPVKASGSLAEALKLVASEPVVLVTGSLYFLGEVLEHFGMGPAAADSERALNDWKTEPSGT